MRVAELIQREFGGLEAVHQSRLRAIAKVTEAVLTVSRMALSLVGRGIAGSATAKAGIKCVDRLLGNVKLHAEISLFYGRIAARMLPAQSQSRPILLIDWTDIGTLWAALVVTLVTEGRGVVLCSEVHPRKMENNPRVESSILKKLQKFLPKGCKPILVSDAGFRGPWLRKVLALGWDFVGRVRGRVSARRNGARSWSPVKCLWAYACSRPKDLGQYSLAKYLPFDARLVAVWKNKHRKKKRLPTVGRRKQKAICSAREPWILATSLTASPREVVRLYALRMRIELTFRDQKCPRFGLALDQVKTEDRKRVEVYLLLATLAHYVAMFIGRAAENAGIHLDYQANSVKGRRVLSWARVGREVILRSLRKALAFVQLEIPPQLGFDTLTYAG